jgi:outer membrane protein, heavy metal efflux system
MRVIVVSLVCLALPPPAAAQPPQSIPFTFSAALERAMTANPAIVAARSRRAVGTAGVAVAGERLNPEGRVEFDRDTPRQSYSVAVPLELGGKRTRRLAVAEAAVRTADAEIAQVIAETRNAVRRAYVERSVAEARLTLLEDLQMLMTRARDAAQQRFDAGDAPRLEVLQAELALAQAQNQVTGARGSATAARMQFNALLGMPFDAPTILAPEPILEPMTFEAAMERARAASAELTLLDRRLDEQRARLALAKALRTPDVTPEGSLTHGFEDVSDFQFGWKAAVAVTMPLFTTHKAGVVLEESTLVQLTAERTAAEARIAGEVAAATAVADAQRQQFLRYRDQIVPQAMQVETMADDAYRLGQTGIAAYLQALQATRDVRLAALQAESELQTALTDLERAIGAPLTP